MSKDIKWLRLCYEAAQLFSTCAKRQYAAYLIDEFGHQIGFGYNGVPRGMEHCDNNGCPRLIANSPSGTDYSNCRSIHAESNAILHSDYLARRRGCTLYVNGSPCWWCAKLIANSGVTRVVFVRDPSYQKENESIMFLLEAGLSVKGYSSEELEEYVQ